jgi:hypothetical protein
MGFNLAFKGLISTKRYDFQEKILNGDLTSKNVYEHSSGDDVNRYMDIRAEFETKMFEHSYTNNDRSF